MKAQYVFENIDFERGRDPKETLDIGGFSLAHVYGDIIDKAEDEYLDFLKKTFIGKTVSGTMGSWEGPRGDWKPTVINVADVEHKFHGAEFTFIDSDGKRFSPLTNQPVKVVSETNENIKFERIGNPKSSLDIGGVKLSYIRKEIIDQAKEDWIQWIYDYIVGKTITGKFNKIAKVTGDGMEFTGEEWNNYTIKVKDIVSAESLAMDNHALFVIAEDNYQYVVPIDDQKIWIK